MSHLSEERKIAAAKRLNIRPSRIPRHIAIIMDGNGRWARKKGLPRFEGHSRGSQTVEKIVRHCVRLGIECLTLYSFSMQNWKRPKTEIDFLMKLYRQYLIEMRPVLMKDQVRLVHLGHLNGLPASVTGALNETVRLTANNKEMILALALNYGSRTEITDAVRRIAGQYNSGRLRLKDIDENCINDNLYTASLPDPDLLIRTAGEMRVSNFLLWQISYCEFYVTKTMWPDFSRANLNNAIKAYAKRERRFGDIGTGDRKG
ncbi:MAG: isoprenyl transferase [Planctomycetota bacterium]